MLHSCNIENCEDTPATIYGGDRKFRKNDERNAWPEGQMIFSYKNNIHMPGISIHYVPKDVAVWPKWTRFNRRHRGYFTLQ